MVFVGQRFRGHWKGLEMSCSTLFALKDVGES